MMMEAPDLEQAAHGDVQAIVTALREPSRELATRLAAMVCLRPDDASHAAVAATVAQFGSRALDQRDDLPPAQVMHALDCTAHDPQYAAVWHEIAQYPVRRSHVASFVGERSAIIDTVSERILLALVNDRPHAAVDVATWVGEHALASPTAQTVRAALVDAAARDSQSAALTAAACWRSLAAPERLRLLRVIAQSRRATAHLLDHHPDYLYDIPPDIRTRMLRKIATARATLPLLGACWEHLNAHERDQALATIRSASVAAQMSARLGAQRVAALDDRQYARLFAFAEQWSPQESAAVARACWEGTKRADQQRLVDQIVAQSHSAVAVIEGMGAQRFATLDAQTRLRLIESAGKTADAAARAIVIVWGAIPDSECAALFDAAFGNPHSAADALATLIGQRRLPRESSFRARGIAVAATAGNAAARLGGAVWNALSDEERGVLRDAIFQSHASSATQFALHLTHDRAAALTPDIRRALVLALMADRHGGAHAACRCWMAFSDEERRMLVKTFAAWPLAAATVVMEAPPFTLDAAMRAMLMHGVLARDAPPSLFWVPREGPISCARRSQRAQRMLGRAIVQRRSA